MNLKNRNYKAFLVERKSPYTLMLVIIFSFLTACSEEGGPAVTAKSQQPVGDNSQINLERKERKPSTALLEQFVEFARNDLAQRMDADPASIKLLGTHEVEWRSGALGCPEPGMNYTQAIVPGLLIRLGVGNDEFDYHAKIDGKPFYCPRERSELPALNQPDAPGTK